MRKLIVVLAVLCSVAGCASPGMSHSGTSGNQPSNQFNPYFQGS